MNTVRGSIEAARDAVAAARHALRWTIKGRFISAAICFALAAFLLFVDSGWEGPFHRLDPYFAIAAAICWVAIGLVMAHAGPESPRRAHQPRNKRIACSTSLAPAAPMPV